MDTVHDGVIVYDAEGNVIFCNETYRDCYPEVRNRLRPGSNLADILRAAAARANPAATEDDLDAWVARRLKERLDPRTRTEIHYINGRWWEIHEYQADDGTIVSQRRDITARRDSALRRAREGGGADGDTPCDSFAVYRGDGRIIATSDDYPSLYPLVSDLVRPGAALDELLRAAGQDDGGTGEGTVEGWLGERLADRRAPADGRAAWWQLTEHRTAGGGVVRIRTEPSMEDELSLEAAHVQAMLADLVDSIEDGFALFDAADRLTLCNQAFQRLTGVMPDLLAPGTPFEAILQGAAHSLAPKGDSRDAWLADRRRQHASAAPPAELPVAGGRWLRWHERRAGGSYLVCTLRDITDLKSREQALQASEVRYRKLVEMAPDLSCILHAGTIDLINHSGARMLGAENAGALAGRPFTVFVHPDFRDLIEDDLDSLAGEEGWIPLRLLRLDGSAFDAEVAVLPFDSETGAGVLLFARDTTDRKRATTALLGREQRLRGIMNTVADGIITIDATGMIESFNPAAEQVFGYAANEVIGENVRLLMPEPLYSADTGRVMRFLQTHMLGSGSEVDGRRKDGSVFPLELAVSELAIDDETLYIGVARDITDRKRYEQELRDAVETAEVANRAKSEFLANMSHELRTPLNAIIGFSDAMLSGMFGPPGNDRYADYLANINDSGKHLLDVINDILDVSRIEAGRLEFAPEPVVVADVAEVCLRLVRERAATAGVTVESTIADGLPNLLSEPRRLKQILLNLLSNAVKFTPEGGRVTVSMAFEPAAGFTLTVADTGIGMEPDQIPKALMPFGQVDSRLARKYEGTGLGLPLTRAFIELHGGSMDLVSRPGEGTTVSAHFPPACAAP